jgi:hypothetical protein
MKTYTLYIHPKDIAADPNYKEIVVFLRDHQSKLDYMIFLFSPEIMEYNSRCIRQESTEDTAKCLHFTNPLLIKDFEISTILASVKAGIYRHGMLNDMITMDNLTDDRILPLKMYNITI